MKKRVLFLRSNPVNPDSRVEKEVVALLKAGHNVEILAWERSCWHLTKSSVLFLGEHEVTIHRIGARAAFGAGKNSLLPFLVFQVRLFLFLLSNKSGFDVVHACDFDTALVGLVCAKLLNKLIVFDIFDFLYSEIKSDVGFFARLLVLLQYEIINKSDATILCSEARRLQIAESSPKRLVVIHNSPPRSHRKIPAFSCFPPTKRIRIVYVGILQDHRFLIEMINCLKGRSDVELHIGGFGKYESYIEKTSKEFDNILFHGKVSYQDAISIERCCDIMTAIYSPCIRNHFYAAPNKFYEALLLGKPLIMVKNTGMSALVSLYNIGELMDDYTIEEFEGALTRVIKRQDEWPKIACRMQSLYDSEYDWGIMEGRLQRLYDELGHRI